MPWIPLAQALALIGGSTMADRLLRALRAGDVVARQDGAAAPLEPHRWQPERTQVDFAAGTLVERSRNAPFGYNPWVTIAVEVDRQSLIAEFGEPPAAHTPSPAKVPGHKAGGGRRKAIIETFLEMVRAGNVKFARSGLRAAARELNAGFPEYALKSIEEMIGPEYRNPLNKPRA